MKISAKIMTFILVFSCLLLIGLTTAGFIVGLNYLNTIAVTTDHAKIDAELATEELETIALLKGFLDDNPDLVAKTGSVIASSQQYQYQDQVLQDIQRFAAESGVRVQSFTFEPDNTATTGATGATPPTTPATPATPTPTIPGLNLSQTLPEGVKTASATITLARPLTYPNLLRFIKRIERNPTQFNLQPLAIQVDTANRANLQTTSIELKVFTK